MRLVLTAQLIMNLCISNGFVFSFMLERWRHRVKCPRCTTRGCPVPVSQRGASFLRQMAERSRRASRASGGTEGRAHRVRLNQWYREDERWWKESTEAEGRREDGEDGDGQDKPFALKAKRGPAQRDAWSKPEVDNWIVNYIIKDEKCVSGTIEGGCDPVSADEGSQRPDG